MLDSLKLASDGIIEQQGFLQESLIDIVRRLESGNKTDADFE